ncbi:MAG: T9SS type A sorting domain-containing protein, partial [Bacteroidales bacterium]|nr:T9SS type A sorting domain-containing protein [Bacteroidales bacterium]
LSGITPHNGDMLKSQNDGYASYLAGYGWYGSLSTLNPGMGLMYKSNAGADIVLTYPEGGTRGDLKSNQTAEGNHWQPDLNAYPDNMSVTAIVELDGSELRSERYELAAFANGECRGSARLLYVEPLNRYMAFLTVAGDEAAGLNFGLYDTETGAVETQCFASLPYETNAIIGSFDEPYVVSFRSTTGVDEWASSLQVFPNPVEHGRAVSLGFDGVETSKVTVEIINALGSVVETLRATSLQRITAPEAAGVYTLRISIEGKGTCYRKLIVR